ncbi:MAG: hypothetical protein GY817_05305 [bacterium]|nr:hypothetical protein [bacterium]
MRKIIVLFFILLVVNTFAGDIYLSLRTENQELETRRQFVLLKKFEVDNPTQRKAEFHDLLFKKIHSNLNLCYEFKVDILDSILLANKPNFFKEIDYIVEPSVKYGTANTVEIKLQYAPEKELILRKKYSLQNLDIMANLICNDIYFNITGEEGYFTTKFAFAYEKTNKEIFIVDFNGKNLKRITRDNSIAILPSWHPKKKALLYTSYKNGNPDLFLIDTTSGETKVISSKQGLNISANFSPTGQEIALSMTFNGNSDIILASFEGQFLAKITNNKWIDSSSAWSNDGSKILFISDQTGISQIYEKNLKTDQTRQLTFDKTFKDSVDYSPVKDEIVYSCLLENKWDICRLDLKSKKIYRLTENQGNNSNPSYAFDGRFLVFTSTRNGKRELFIMNNNGDNVRLVLPLSGSVFAPVWSPLYE